MKQSKHTKFVTLLIFCLGCSPNNSGTISNDSTNDSATAEDSESNSPKPVSTDEKNETDSMVQSTTDTNNADGSVESDSTSGKKSDSGEETDNHTTTDFEDSADVERLDTNSETPIEQPDTASEEIIDAGIDSSTDISASDPETDSDTHFDINADAGSGSPWPSEKYISIESVYEKVSYGTPNMLLINVVDEVFYDLGHIEGSLKITWDTLQYHLDEVDVDQYIIVYCRKGVRSESAYATLKENGYESVWVMEGGIEAWIAKGFPTVP